MYTFGSYGYNTWYFSLAIVVLYSQVSLDALQGLMSGNNESFFSKISKN